MTHRLAIPGCALSLALFSACLNPTVAQEKYHTFQASTLGFIQDGKTTRQEILLRLGTPVGQFEGDRILTYDFVRDQAGEWRRVGTTSLSDWRFNYIPGSSSLVLVFRPDGVLERHALVPDREWPPPTSGPDKQELPSEPR
jgi:hypothetical protein